MKHNAGLMWLYGIPNAISYAKAYRYFEKCSKIKKKFIATATLCTNTCLLWNNCHTCTFDELIGLKI